MMNSWLLLAALYDKPELESFVDKVFNQRNLQNVFKYSRSGLISLGVYILK